LCILGNFFG